MARIRTTIRQRLSARHVPEIILEIKEIPYTASGKKVEVAVKRILAGEHIKSRGALANPNSLDLYYNIAQLKQGQCRKHIEQKQSRGIFFKLFLIPARHSRVLKLKQQNGDHNNTSTTFHMYNSWARVLVFHWEKNKTYEELVHITSHTSNLISKASTCQNMRDYNLQNPGTKHTIDNTRSHTVNLNVDILAVESSHDMLLMGMK